MDKNYVKTVIDGLKSTSSSRVYEALLKIRSKVIDDENGLQLFRELDGLDYLVTHLRKPNERILDLTLSILGNLCLHKEICFAAGKLNLIVPLMTVLKTVRRDSIIGRAIRVIGNLAQSPANAKELHNHGAISSLVTVIKNKDKNTSCATLIMAVRAISILERACRVISNLAQRPTNAEEVHNHGAISALVTLIENRDKNTSYPTLIMAVHAMRQLWMVTEKREEMLSLNTVHCVAILLTTQCESAGLLKSSSPHNKSTELRKSQEVLISGILKCLGYITTHATIECAEQVQGDGKGYQTLVVLTNSFESLALRCLMNLCYQFTCRPELGTAGMVECLVRILQKNPAIPSRWPEGAARTLSLLSRESVNRSRLRYCGGLPLLVAAAKEDIDAMRALLLYYFDDTSFEILINEGLITLLTDDMIKYLTTMKFKHNFKEKSESKLDDSQTNDCVQDASTSSNVVSDQSEEKPALNQRRKGPLSNTTEDELKVVIEGHNTVGFTDAINSSTDDSANEDGETPKRKDLKRARLSTPKKKNQAKNKDLSVGVPFEPKSPECPSTSQMRCIKHGSLSSYSDDSQPGFSPDYRYVSKKGRFELCPESGNVSGEGAASPNWTEYQWSPSSSSGPASPFSNNDDSSDSEISGRYSPVCSDDDAPEVFANVAKSIATGEWDGTQFFDELLFDDEDITYDDEVISNDDESLDGQIIETYIIGKPYTTSRLACVRILLYRVAHGVCERGGRERKVPAPNNMMELLTGKECLNALLDFVERCRKPMGRELFILTRILSNPLCLVNILKHKLALRLHRMSITSKHPASRCLQCAEVKKLSAIMLALLTTLAESSFGVGVITYQLLRGPANMRETLTMTLPYIVKSEKTLKKFFIDCRALDPLFTAVAEDTADCNLYVTALGKIASNILIKDPKVLENKFSHHAIVSYDPILNNLSKEEIVVFELDDLSTVSANKAFICQNSDVFSAMLMGCFKESLEERVRIKNVTKQGLEHLFTLLQLGFNDSKNDAQVFPMAQKLETNLEVLLLADRFLIDKLKDVINNAFSQFLLTPETAVKVYMWSLNEGMGFLCVEAVAYLLTGRMKEVERTRSFKAILNSKYKEQWLDDVKTIIVRQLEGIGHQS